MPKPNTSRFLHEYRLPVLLTLLATLFLGILLGASATHLLGSLFRDGDGTNTDVVLPRAPVPVPKIPAESADQNSARDSDR